MIKTGDTVRDGRGRAFQIGQLMGRGLWGRAYAAREDGSGSEWIVKLPYTENDLPPEEAGLAEACRNIFDEQLRILQSAPGPGLVEVETHFVLQDSTPVMVLERKLTNLERRLNSGCGLEELLRTLLDVGLRLQELAEYIPCHGNLKGTNILLDDRGSVFLSDPMCPAFKRALPGLLRVNDSPEPYMPPELRHGSASSHVGEGIDSYSLSMLLYRGAMAIPGDEGLREPELPMEGIDKGRMVELKDTILNRLKKEHSNPRFHTRLSDRTAALLNRALSRETSPSPPYRFRKLEEFLTRTEELLALVHPAVSYVGRIILPQQSLNEGFSTDHDVTFSCTVACTPGVESQDEIACGLAAFDAGTDERLRDVPCAYTVERHPSGRFRFSFRVSDLPPGSYRIRTAFTLRESGDEPLTTEAEFSIRPSPGYVPPIREPESRPLQVDFGGQEPNASGDSREETVATEGAGTEQAESLDSPPPATPTPTPIPTIEQAEDEPDFPMPTPVAPPSPSPEPNPAAATAQPASAVTTTSSIPPDTAPRTEEATEDFRDSTHDEAEPSFSGTGRWSDLPLPNQPSSELTGRRAKAKRKKKKKTEEQDTDAVLTGESAGPVGDFIARTIESIRGDQFVMFIGIAALAIIGLAVLLIQLQG